MYCLVATTFDGTAEYKVICPRLFKTESDASPFMSDFRDYLLEEDIEVIKVQCMALMPFYNPREPIIVDNLNYDLPDINPGPDKDMFYPMLWMVKNVGFSSENYDKIVKHASKYSLDFEVDYD